MIIDVQLVTEALNEIKPYDKTGEMKRRIDNMMDIAEAADGETVDRAELALVITGDEDEACETLANAYAKALHAHGLVPGNDEGSSPVVGAVNWPGDVEDICATRDLMEDSWANGKMNDAKDRSAGGTLVIKGLYRKPYAGYPDEDDAATKATSGGLQAISTLMTGLAMEEETPVVVLTGPAGRLGTFFNAHADIARLFEGKTVEAGPPKPPVEISTTLENSITVRLPLKLKIVPASMR